MQLSTGLVIAGAYADKLRKTLFAQLRDRVKAGEISGSEVARAAGEMNRYLFEVLVNKLKVDKGDVVRVRVNYDVKDGRIVWDYDSLRLEAFRRIPDEEVQRALREVKETGEGKPEYTAEKVGGTPLGDVVYKILENGREVGLIIATPVDGEVVVRGALTRPPAKVERTRIPLRGSLDDTVRTNVSVLTQQAAPVPEEEANRIIKEIRELLE